jgi:acyl-CoA thioester hydrolase
MDQPAHAFMHQITVRPADIDELGHVNNVVHVRWIQEVSQAHWHHVAPETLRQRYRWVVLRHEIDYRNPVVISDKIGGTTWVGAHHGARFERFVQLSSLTDKKVFAEAKTIWCILDTRIKKTVRIPDEVLQLL